MIIEDYCSFEVAKLLKEKGFDEICRKFYKCCPTNPKLYCCDKSQMFDYCTNSSLSRFNYVGEEMNIAAPTQQMAMKWLMEVHNIYMDIAPTHSTNGPIHFIWQTYNSDYLVTGDCDIFYPTYEQAVEAAIKYCLENLI